MQQQIPWWADHLLLPIVFIVVGAALGFVLTWLKASLDAKAAKDAFLAAIRSELSSLRDQLAKSSDTLADSMSRFRDGGSPPHLAGTLRTTVFSSQLLKLTSLA